MSLLFLSHSSIDNPAAQALADWLSAEGWTDLFLDLDPERGIAAGERWERALHQAASRCDAVLFLISKHWLRSDWCRRELGLALRLNKRIFALLIEGLPKASLPVELTGSWQMVDLAAGNDHGAAREVTLPGQTQPSYVYFSRAGLQRLRVGLQKAGLDPQTFVWPPAHDPRRAPYRGMKPLESEDAGIFFGREAPITELLAQLRGLRAGAPPRMLVILGASGAGKSSFLRAGILPRLARDDRHYLPLPVLRPEQAVLTGSSGLLASLREACRLRGLRYTRKQLADAVAGGAVSLRPLLLELAVKATVADSTGDAGKPPMLVLSIDQGEELFQAEGQDEAKCFLTLVRELLTQELPTLMTVFTIRSDRYDTLQSAPELESVAQKTFSLPPLPRGAYRQVIEEPAKLLNGSERPLRIEPALTEALLQDIERGGAKDALPLLAFTLERLYLDCGDDGDLTLSEYRELGRIDGAIESAVEHALKAAQRDPGVPRDRDACLKLLRRGLIPWIAGIDPQTNLPRRKVAKLSHVPETAQVLIAHFVEHRLLTTDRDELGETTVEPAHEALLRQWSKLKGWLEEDATALSTLESVKAASRDWVVNNRDAKWLAHQAGRLEDAEALQQREDLADSLEDGDQAYLAACRNREDERRDSELRQARDLAEARDREARVQEVALRQARQSAKRMRTALAVVLTLVMVSVVTAWFANSQRREANSQRREARQTSERLSKEVEQASRRALGRALQAEKEGNEPARYAYLAESLSLQPLPESREMISAILQGEVVKVDGSVPVHLPGTLRSFAINRSGLSTLKVYSNGDLVVSGSASTQISTGPLLTDVVDAEWCKTDDCLIAYTNDQTARILDPSGRELRSFGVQRSKFGGGAVSSNGEAAAYVDNGVLQLAYPSKPDGIALTESSDESALISFSPSSQFVSFQERGRIRAWRIAAEEPRLEFDYSGEELNTHAPAVVFSNSGKWLAFAEYESISIVDLENGERTRLLEHYEGAGAGLVHIEFTNDSTTLVVVWSGNWRYPGEVWVVRDLSMPTSVVRHQAESEISSCTLHPAAKGIVFESLGSCHAISLDGRAPHFKIETCPESAHHVEYSPDGRWLLAASTHSVVKLWSIGFEQVGAPLRRSQGGSVEIAPSGDWIIDRSYPVHGGGDVYTFQTTLWPLFDAGPISDLTLDINAGTVLRTEASRTSFEATPETLQKALVGISGYQIAGDGRLESLRKDALAGARAQLSNLYSSDNVKPGAAYGLIHWHLSVPRDRRIAPTSAQSVDDFSEELEAIVLTGRSDLRRDALRAAEDLYLLEPSHPVALVVLASMTEDDTLASLWLASATRRFSGNVDQLSRLIRLAHALEAPKAVLQLATAARLSNSANVSEHIAWAESELTTSAAELQRCSALAEADLPDQDQVFTRILRESSSAARRLAIAEALSTAESTLAELDRCVLDGDPGRMNSVEDNLTSRRLTQIDIGGMLGDLRFTGDDESDIETCVRAPHNIAFGWNMDDAGRIQDLTGRRAFELAKAACPQFRHPHEDM